MPVKSHGLSKTRTYKLWSYMIQRCRRDPYYVGVPISERWRRFENFLIDMGHPPPGMELERIKPEVGYLPWNCRWATRKEQMNNTRRTPRITLNGVTKSRKQWCEELGLNYWLVRTRMDFCGWSAEDAFLGVRQPDGTRADPKANAAFRGIVTAGKIYRDRARRERARTNGRASGDVRSAD